MQYTSAATAASLVPSRIWTERSNTRKRTTLPSLEFIITQGISISVGVITSAETIMHFFYGAKYKASVIMSQALSTGLILLCAEMVLGTTLLLSDAIAQEV
jgi:O-antigen/teichoic acid export membrane protein